MQVKEGEYFTHMPAAPQQGGVCGTKAGRSSAKTAWSGSGQRGYSQSLSFQAPQSTGS
jgi:hypothetical protein